MRHNTHNTPTDKTPSFGLPVDLVAGKKDAKEGDNKGKAKQQKGKAAGMKALEVAQQSTASLGRYVPFSWLYMYGQAETVGPLVSSPVNPTTRLFGLLSPI